MTPAIGVIGSGTSQKLRRAYQGKIAAHGDRITHVVTGRSARACQDVRARLVGRSFQSPQASALQTVAEGFTLRIGRAKHSCLNSSRCADDDLRPIDGD